MLRQLIETYGFDRVDIRADYRLTTRGKRQRKVDVVIFRRGEEAVDEHVERVIVCQGLPPLDPDVPRHVSLLRPCDKRVYPVAEKLISTINVPVPLSAFE